MRPRASKRVMGENKTKFIGSMMFILITCINSGKWGADDMLANIFLLEIGLLLTSRKARRYMLKNFPIEFSFLALCFFASIFVYNCLGLFAFNIGFMVMPGPVGAAVVPGAIPARAAGPAGAVALPGASVGPSPSPESLSAVLYDFVPLPRYWFPYM